ncbi:MAG: ABC transporter ATP-binding protein [Eubacteriales bacterium]|nr:ABC transporter ATP-binding protein [Eubacteriales bacterium]
MDDIILSVKDLEINFNTYAGVVHAVRGVSFDLHRGETLAIVGESGSGKSVTTNAVMKLIPKGNGIYAGGSINFEGRDLIPLSDKEMSVIRGKEIAMIFQDPMTSLNPTMKIGHQIREVIMKHRGLKRAEAKAEAIRLLTLVDIAMPEMRYHQYPHEFSGGMRQRVVIAIALAGQPKVLIADEPTTALDVTIQAQILELLKRIQKKMGTSIIFITHDLGVVANVADRVAVMYSGKILEIGTADEIFYSPRHPYTWGLLSSMPDLASSKEEPLHAIVGSPPNLIDPPKGDPFAPRNPYAMKIDFEQEPPMFKVSETHYVKSWLLHEQAPEVEPPAVIRRRMERYANEIEGKKVNG